MSNGNDVQTKDWVTWGLLIAGLYLLAKQDCGCGQPVSCASVPSVPGTQDVPMWIQRLGADVNA